MHLRDAYALLGLDPAVARELDLIARTRRVRGLGTSTRMIVELYLDCVDAHAVRRAQQFLVVCVSRHQGVFLRGLLEGVHGVLRLTPEIPRVTFLTEDAGKRLEGTTWPSWAIYCDHAVREHLGRERLVGPYGILRRFTQKGPDQWVGTDRDGTLICAMPQRSALSIVESSSCPVTYHYQDGVAPVTFPPWQNPTMRVRLVEAFKS